MQKEEIKYVVERIEHLEKIFDEVKNSFENEPDFFENENMAKKVSLLTQYMDSGQWLRDYSLDEKGELPKELKRGILSEDGLYNLICDIEQGKKSKANPLFKFFKKDEILFAVFWIIIYVLGFGNSDMLSESIGIPKLITVIFGILLSAGILVFTKTNNLSEYFGLCKPQKSAKEFLFYIPLVIISSVNLWFGFTSEISPVTAVLSVLSMFLVGFLEEIIFRGMFFKGMAKNGIKTAIIVSSLTFGFGHIVNLLFGAPVFETLLQLVYASAVGFCYTAIFYRGKSIVPCIVSHIFVNSTSVFTLQPSAEIFVISTIIQTVLGIGYGIYILKKKEARA